MTDATVRHPDRGQNLLRAAGLMFLANALAQAAGFALSGAGSLPVLGAAAVSLAFGLVFLRGIGWPAWLGFLWVIFGVSAALWQVMGLIGVAQLVFLAVLVLNLLIGVTLFLFLWRR